MPCHSWGRILGPVGMLVSVPLTMSLKISFNSNFETRWIEVLLGRGEPASEEQQAEMVDPGS